MLTDFHFIRPYCLFVLIPYVVVISLMLRNKLSQGNWSNVCDAALLPYLLQKEAISQSRLPLIAGALAAFLTILALAGPTWNKLPSPAFRNDAALVIALDLSRSMDAGDIKPNRLTMARYKIADILKHRKDGQSALLVYAGDAFVVTPLTNDTETIISQLSALNTDIMPSEGSNTAMALEKATALFKQAGLPQGHILLVTDGANFDSTLTAVNTLDNYQLSILGVGTADGAPIALADGGFLKDKQGAIVVPKLDSVELAKLAAAGHGTYQTLGPSNEDTQDLLSFFDTSIPRKASRTDNLALDIWNDRGPWLLLIALPLVLLSFRKGILCLALLMILPYPKSSYAFEWHDLWHTKDQQGTKAYQSGNFANAASHFENPAWKTASYFKAGNYDKALDMLKNAKTSDDFYNKGNALAQSGQLADALKAYKKSLTLNPNNADAKYNKELIEKELEKQQQQQQDQQTQQNNQDQQKSEQHSAEEKNQDQDSKTDSQKPEQKSEQTQENSANQKKSDSEQADTQNKDQNKPKTEQDAKPESEPTQAEKSNQESLAPKTQAVVPEEQPSEQQQANEQWLKRIPDDPAGLLKRKFKYQYGQQEHPANDSAYSW